MDISTMNLTQLRKLCKFNNIHGYSKLGKSDLVKLLESREIDYLIDLEPNVDQQRLLDCVKTDFETEKSLRLISAGPGTGKTTILIEILKRHISADKRAIFISFNSEIERKIRNMISTKTEVKIMNRKSSLTNTGVRIATFHKMAYSILSSTSNVRYLEGLEMDEVLFKASLRLKDLPIFDYLFIDEAHDVSEDILDFAAALIKHSKHVLIAGDPRQEINTGSSWFTRLLNENHHLSELSFNHRSGSRIVRLLNKYSEQAFSYSHLKQISASEHRGKVHRIELAKEDLPFELFRLITNYKNLIIISPVSAAKFGLNDIFEKTNNLLHEKNHLKKIKILKSEDKLIEDQSFVYAATSAKFKGLEKNNVVLLNAELDYSKLVEDRLYKRRLFVALSRARKNLFLINCNPVNNPYFGLVYKTSNFKNVEKFEYKQHLITHCKSLRRFYKPEMEKCLFQKDNYLNLKIFKDMEKIDLQSIDLFSLRESLDLKLKLQIPVHFKKNNDIIYITEEKDPEWINKVIFLAAHYVEDIKAYNLETQEQFVFKYKSLYITYFKHFEVPFQIARFEYLLSSARSSKFKRVKIPSLEGKTLITFDLETYRCYPKRGCLLWEAGGLAFTTSGKILDMIYQLGDLEQNPLTGIYEYANSQTASLSSELIYQNCQEWAAKFNHSEISLKWAANESDYAIIGAKFAQEIDVMKIYQEWRTLNQIERSFKDGHRSLSDCVFDLFSSTIPFYAHCAFEDAGMTMVCFMAMIEEEKYD